ncbi:hypothetical protein Aab01nite_01960 [Paractinoplanes abujensis]|uniref:Thoeris protein ThsA Macro domain-containing protein n=1 Tax=Paractinoplanes abujensis TaxID=882441 RepID=A0A7W7G2T6_9ACTN|nr:macro domain-containing protein [Actinoplanes abujensis]MBB4691976.1 hypothetical protein [Actinoplanes abujensis]GID16606.1 hypothetical protein Aab01nite_01960 [Actinoplanes abujensis]
MAALLLQSYQAVWDRALFAGHAVAVALAVAAVSLAYGVWRARPARAVTRDLDRPRCRVEVVPGDLFEQADAHLVIGFTDVFDTDVGDGRIVQESSVQGQFLRRIYLGDVAGLDADLDEALAGTPFTTEGKTLGKRRRYPVGTIATLGEPDRLFFCVAYSEMGPSLVAQSSADKLWLSLSRLWSELHDRGQQRPLAMPVVGATLARVDALDREALLRLILLSFVAASRERLLTTRLRIVVRPGEFARLNRAELQAFLDSL